MVIDDPLAFADLQASLRLVREYLRHDRAMGSIGRDNIAALAAELDAHADVVEAIISHIAGTEYRTSADR